MEAPVGLSQREFIPSEHSFHADELTTKLTGCAILGLFKNPVEVRDVVESAVVAYLTNTLFGFDKPSGRITDAGIVHIIDKSLSGAALDESIEGNRTHIDQIGDLIQVYFSVKVFLDKFIDPFDALAVLEIVQLGSLGRQQRLIFRGGQLTQYGNEFQKILHPVELGQSHQPGHDLQRRFL